MSATVVQMETLCDPDVGLELRPEFEDRLHESLAYVDDEGKLISLEEMARHLEAE